MCVDAALNTANSDRLMQEHPPEHQAGHEAGAMLAPGLEESYAELRRVPLFDGIPNDDLWAAISAGGIRRHVIRRDAFVADPANLGGGSNLFFVVEGQLAVGVFDPLAFAARRQDQDRFDALSDAERRSESALAPQPLARLARKNLAVFVDGDLFNSDALPQEPESVVAFYTTAPSVVARIDPDRMSDFVLRFPFFRDARAPRHRARARSPAQRRRRQARDSRFLRAPGAVRCRLHCARAPTRSLHRLQAVRRRVRGALRLQAIVPRRLSAGHARLRVHVSHVHRPAVRGPVRIRIDLVRQRKAPGRHQRSQLHRLQFVRPAVPVRLDRACGRRRSPGTPSYREDYRIRLEADGALKFGAGAPRVARARRVANKCDHCADYSEQACITSCPTGSLIEIDAYDLFRERKPGAAAVARSGYDQEAPRDRRELLPIRPFVHGAKVRQGGLARIKRFRVGAAVIWALGLAAWFLCLAEIGLRLYAPTHSLQYQIELLESPPAVALLQVGYRAGNDLAVYCGYIGTGLLLLAILYPIVRRINAFRFVANARVWFDLHLMAGTVGPMFIVLHSAFKLDNWVSAAFWSMIIVAISGVVGRYMYNADS